jgi:peptidyl-prolyl cis-trans isomerase SurA
MFKKILFIACLAVLVCTAFAESAILLDKVMAIVNKDVVTWSDLYKAMEFEATDQIKAMKDEDRRRFFKESEPLFLENLIDARLQLQEAAKLGVTASDEDVNKAVESIKKKYSMTDEEFKNAIGREGFTFPEYKKKISEQITVSRVVEQEVRSRILVTDAEIDAYIADNKELAKETEGFHISHIFLKKTENAKQVEDRAMGIYKKIKAGENFADAARQYSEDATARSGGDLGFIKKADLSKEFLDVLSKLQAGAVSEPFWGGNGVHILKLNERVELKTPKDLRDKVRQKFLEERFNAEYKSWVKGLREKAYVEIKQ